MGKTLLLMGSETLLGRKIIEQYLSNNYQVIVTIPTSKEEVQESTKPNLKVIPWNRPSLVSAKAVIREIHRTYQSLDMAIFVNPEVPESRPLGEMNFDAIEEVLGTHIHGIVYLIKEVLALQTGPGVLSFAKTVKGQTPSSPISALISQGFHGLADQILLTKPQGKLYCGFSSPLTEMGEYAQFIFETLGTLNPKAHGEWLLHSERRGLFRSLPIIKRT